MSTAATLFFIALLACGIVLITLQFYIKAMKKMRVVEIPNGRSLHTTPIPTGAGLILISTVFSLWFAEISEYHYAYVVLASCTLVVAAVSLIDDLIVLSPLIRLIVQTTAIVVLLLMIPEEDRVIFSGLNYYVDRILVGAGWLWFVNLYNFMDGVDGLAAVETIAISLGIVAIGLIINLSPDLILLSALIGGATLGFLYWNWCPARVLLGDVGSISLGLVLGWLLIQLAIKGYLIAAVILPAFFLTDATITIVKRILNFEPFWRPHRQHSYQQPALAGVKHLTISGMVAATNIVIVAAAVMAIRWPIMGLAIASIASSGLLYYFQTYKLDNRQEKPDLI